MPRMRQCAAGLLDLMKDRGLLANRELSMLDRMSAEHAGRNG